MAGLRVPERSGSRFASALPIVLVAAALIAPAFVLSNYHLF
jgi:hypothetical protein